MGRHTMMAVGATILVVAASAARAVCPLPASWAVPETLTKVASDANGNILAAGGGTVAKYSAGGVLQWKVRCQSADLDPSGGAYGVAATPEGDVVVAGSVDLPDGRPVGYLRKFGADGSPVWSTTYAGALLDAIAVSPCGDVVAAGIEPVQGGAILVAYSPAGALLWARTSDGAGGTGIDAAGG